MPRGAHLVFQNCFTSTHRLSRSSRLAP